MGFIRFILSKAFAVQMALAVALAGLSLVVAHYWMAAATEHGTTVEVPDFRGIRTGELPGFADTLALEYAIIDSIYSDEFPKGTVADQDPAAGTQAKRGRKVYLTVNAVMPQQVKLPELRNLSLRQAKAVLETVGLRLGTLEYYPDIAKNAVLEQKHRGRSVKGGMLVFRGATIDLVLGDGLSDTEMPVPYMIYRSYHDAMDLLRLASLNVGALVIDTPFTDTARVRVYRQVPAFTDRTMVRMGTPIDLFFTQDTASIRYDEDLYYRRWVPDTSAPVYDYEPDDFEN